MVKSIWFTAFWKSISCSLGPLCARLRDWSVFEDVNRSGEEWSLASYEERNVVCSECEPQEIILCLYTVHLVLTCFCFCFSVVLFSLPKGMNKVYGHDQINLSISVSKMRIVNYFSHYIHAQNLPNYSDTSNLLIGNLKFKKNPGITKERTITDIKEQSHTF